MPRNDIKPFFRRYTKSYYVQIDGKQINLGRDKNTAFKKCRELLQSREAVNAATTTVKGLIAQYLEWCLNHRSEATYYAAQFYLKSFAKTIGDRMKIEEVVPKHVHAWIEMATTWSSTSKHDAITVLQRVFSWAINEKILDHHPLQRIEGKPQRQRREIYYSPEQWQAILKNVRDQNFLDLIEFLSETGCRPFEARIIEASHCDIHHGLVILKRDESKGKKSRRTLVLTGKAKEICARLCERHATGPIFRKPKVDEPTSLDSQRNRSFLVRAASRRQVSNNALSPLRSTITTVESPRAIFCVTCGAMPKAVLLAPLSPRMCACWSWMS